MTAGVVGINAGAITKIGCPVLLLARFGPGDAQWTRQVLAVGSGFHRAIGSVETLIEKAKSMGQQWLQGITTARTLATAKA